ncbi:hypothetical protein Sros01_72760 [Streptomyces roseochromogenus]|nr:hypothetical protein Sros01_72760 [Streptomyces roseochromogenus]
MGELAVELTPGLGFNHHNGIPSPQPVIPLGNEQRAEVVTKLQTDQLQRSGTGSFRAQRLSPLRGTHPQPPSQDSADARVPRRTEAVLEVDPEGTFRTDQQHDHEGGSEEQRWCPQRDERREAAEKEQE